LHKLKIVLSIPYFAMGVKPQYLLTKLHAITIANFLFLDETQIQSLRCCSWNWEIQVMVIWQFMRKFTLLHGAERVWSQYGNLCGFGHSITYMVLGGVDRWFRTKTFHVQHVTLFGHHVLQVYYHHQKMYHGQENNINCHPGFQTFFNVWAYIIKLIFCYECDASIFVWKSFLFECEPNSNAFLPWYGAKLLDGTKIWFILCGVIPHNHVHDSFSILNQVLLTSHISHFCKLAWFDLMQDVTHNVRQPIGYHNANGISILCFEQGCHEIVVCIQNVLVVYTHFIIDILDWIKYSCLPNSFSIFTIPTVLQIFIMYNTCNCFCCMLSIALALESIWQLSLSKYMGTPWLWIWIRGVIIDFPPAPLPALFNVVWRVLVCKWVVLWTLLVTN
jgi:hypothetical protein